MRAISIRSLGLAVAAGFACVVGVPSAALAQYRSYGSGYVGAPMPILPASRGLDEGGPAPGKIVAPKRRPVVAAPKKPPVKRQAKLVVPGAEVPTEAPAIPMAPPPQAAPAAPAPKAQPATSAPKAAPPAPAPKAAPAPPPPAPGGNVAMATPAYLLPPLIGVPSVLAPPTRKPTETEPTLPEVKEKRADAEPRAPEHVVPAVRLVYPPMGDQGGGGQQ